MMQSQQQHQERETSQGRSCPSGEGADFQQYLSRDVATRVRQQKQHEQHQQQQQQKQLSVGEAFAQFGKFRKPATVAHTMMVSENITRQWRSHTHLRPLHKPP
jgi:hypothetical protein